MATQILMERWEDGLIPLDADGMRALTDWDIIEKSIDSWEAFEAVGRLRNQTTDEELVGRIELSLKVLFPNEAETSYIRAAHCILHEVKR